MAEIIRSLEIGGIKFKNNLVLAPMAGFSDVGLRQLCLELGAGLAVCEMVSAKALSYNNAKTKDLLLTSSVERDRAYCQIFGSEPETMAKVIEQSPLLNFPIIDINMGCPVPKVVKNGEGSSLMKNMALAQRVITQCVKAAGNRPVTVKIRSGWDDSSINCAEFAAMCESAGAAAVTLHARTREQQFKGRANRQHFALVKRALKKIPLIANGDICSYEDIRQIYELSGADGFMIGRAALGNPQIFSELLNTDCKYSRLDIILRHIDILRKFFKDALVNLQMRAHLSHYLHHQYGARELKQRIFGINDMDEIVNHLKLFYSTQK